MSEPYDRTIDEAIWHLKKACKDNRAVVVVVECGKEDDDVVDPEAPAYRFITVWGGTAIKLRGLVGAIESAKVRIIDQIQAWEDGVPDDTEDDLTAEEEE